MGWCFILYACIHVHTWSKNECAIKCAFNPVKKAYEITSFEFVTYIFLFFLFSLSSEPDYHTKNYSWIPERQKEYLKGKKNRGQVEEEGQNGFENPNGWATKIKKKKMLCKQPTNFLIQIQ